MNKLVNRTVAYAYKKRRFFMEETIRKEVEYVTKRELFWQSMTGSFIGSIFGCSFWNVYIKNK
jgi:hypothetical protein